MSVNASYYNTMSTVVDQVALLQEGIAALTGQLDEFEAAREAVRESGIASRVLTRLLDDTDINHGDTGWVLLSSVVVSDLNPLTLSWRGRE